MLWSSGGGGRGGGGRGGGGRGGGGRGGRGGGGYCGLLGLREQPSRVSEPCAGNAF